MGELSLDLAASYIATGLDPEKVVLFKQSDVPAHTELAWIFDTITTMPYLMRAHAFKDAEAKNSEITVGTFNYPMLMAADILLYDTAIVPVGQDQKQHIEFARDTAEKFNRTFSEVFSLPEPHILPDVAVVPGIDGQKMSKSYGNTLEIFGEEKPLRKKVMGIKMDSRTPEEPKPDADKNLAIELLKLVATADVASDFENRLRAGGLGYGDLKKGLFEHYWYYFAEARQKRAELAANLDYVNGVLAEGALKARTLAQTVLKRARKASGLE